MAKRNFSRPYKKQTGYPSYAIVSDGETEKWYFQLMKEAEGVRSYITYRCNLKGSLEKVYSQVVDILKDEYTRVFWIIDYDVVIKEEREFRGDGLSPLQRLKKILEEADDRYHSQLQVVFNNPCLEFWYLLHYIQTNRCYLKYEGELKRKLLSFIPKYDKTETFYKNKNLYLMLKDKQNFAIQNSRALDSFDLDNVEHACADIYKVVEFFLGTAPRQ